MLDSHPFTNLHKVKLGVRRLEYVAPEQLHILKHNQLHVDEDHI